MRLGGTGWGGRRPAACHVTARAALHSASRGSAASIGQAGSPTSPGASSGRQGLIFVGSMLVIGQALTNSAAIPHLVRWDVM